MSLPQNEMPDNVKGYWKAISAKAINSPATDIDKHILIDACKYPQSAPLSPVQTAEYLDGNLCETIFKSTQQIFF